MFLFLLLFFALLLTFNVPTFCFVVCWFVVRLACAPGRVTNLYNMLPVRSAAQLEVLLLIIRYCHQAKLTVMLGSFFAGVADWIKVGPYFIALWCGVVWFG